MCQNHFEKFLTASLLYIFLCFGSSNDKKVTKHIVLQCIFPKRVIALLSRLFQKLRVIFRVIYKELFPQEDGVVE